MGTRPRVLLTEPVFPEVAYLLHQHVELDVGERGVYNTEAALKAVFGQYDGVLSMLSNPITQAVLETAPRLKVIANHAVGYNNIDIDACKSRSIRVANTPGVLTDATADGTLALLLALVRRIPEAQQHLRDGNFDGWHPTGFLGLELRGQVLGIIGMGRIGTAVAERCRAFGMQIIYHNRKRASAPAEARLQATYIKNVHELAQQSDIITLHCPLSDATHHLVDTAFLSVMKESAYLINATRGPVVDEAALAAALHAHQIAGAGIDVYEQEPAIHASLLDAPNTVLTPHITSATHHTRRQMGMLAAAAILNELCGMDLKCNFVV